MEQDFSFCVTRANGYIGLCIKDYLKIAHNKRMQPDASKAGAADAGR